MLIMSVLRIIFSISVSLIFYLPCLSASQINFRPAGEEIYVHTDRDIYISGEEMFFRLYMYPGKENESLSRIAYLVLRNDKNTNIVSVAAEIEESGTWGRIYLPDTLSTGIYHLTSFTSWMKNFGDDTFSNKSLMIINRFDKSMEAIQGGDNQTGYLKTVRAEERSDKSRIIINTCSSEYDINQVAQIVIDPGRIDSMVYMSVAIVPEKSLLDPFGSQTTPSEETSIPAEYPHIKEDQGFILSGRVTDARTDKGIDNVKVLLTTPGKKVTLKNTSTHPDGRFYLLLNRFYEGRDLYITLDQDVEENNLNIIIDEKTSLPARATGPVLVDNNTREYILFSQDVVRVRKIYDPPPSNTQESLEKNNHHPPLVYSKPLHTIYPENFEHLNDFQEISRELLRFIRIRKQNDIFQARMLDQRSEYSFFSEEPAIFLDGLIINNINSIMHLASNDIERIEVHNYQWVFGDIIFPGILAVFTRNELYRHINLPEPHTIFENNELLQKSGCNIPNPLENPEHYTEKPDFRQLLFWEPGIILKNGSKYKSLFYTSELTGDFVVIVTGITSAGKKLWGVKEITVK